MGSSSPVAGHVSRETAPHQPHRPKLAYIKVGLDMFNDCFSFTLVDLKLLATLSFLVETLQCKFFVCKTELSENDLITNLQIEWIV